MLLLISWTQDVAFIKKIKYETMETMDIDPEQIKLLKKIDEQTFSAWRDIAFLKMMDIYPKQYSLRVLLHLPRRGFRRRTYR